MRKPADLLSRLLQSNARDADVVDVAVALAPFGHRDGLDEPSSHADHGKSLLRRAIERSTPMSLPGLDAIASTHAGGSSEAWLLANDPPLLDHLAWRLARSDRGCPQISIDLALRIISVSTPDQISTAEGSDAPLSAALLDHSSRALLGIEPFLALARRQGRGISQARLPDGSPAILRARCPEALDAFLGEGGDLREDFGGRPLWDALRERAARLGTDRSLAAAVQAWASLHESSREADREIRQYFAQLSAYRGHENLKSRKDWHQVRDSDGRSSLMAVCMGNAQAIKSFWSVKKSYPAAAIFDRDGRGLWHAMLLHGKDAPNATAAYLAEHAPLRLDAGGRGLLPSLWAMRVDGRMGSEQEWLFEAHELARACSFAPHAHAWLACGSPHEANAFGLWLANERYLGSQVNGRPATRARSIDILATLSMNLDSASYAAIAPAIAGALAFNLAIAPSHLFATHDVEAKIAAILSHGAHVELSDDRKAILALRASQPVRALIQHAFSAAEERQALAAWLPMSSPAPEAPGRRSRI